MSRARKPADMIGKQVAWSSQASGTVKKKQGEVVAFIPAGQDVSDYMRPEYKPASPGYLKVATEDRFLVLIKRIRSSVYYMPQARIILDGKATRIIRDY